MVLAVGVSANFSSKVQVRDTVLAAVRKRGDVGCGQRPDGGLRKWVTALLTRPKQEAKKQGNLRKEAVIISGVVLVNRRGRSCLRSD
ncbi:hypothetical protein BaRGS_00015962 [Batillaria attramentaria]|uniref:Uncharacterized protein n=1 Tax=Batillaria attramentaria TaxID=370345 RepID=A0ABD0L011_9CAEN